MKLEFVSLDVEVSTVSLQHKCLSADILPSQEAEYYYRIMCNKFVCMCNNGFLLQRNGNKRKTYLVLSALFVSRVLISSS